MSGQMSLPEEPGPSGWHVPSSVGQVTQGPSAEPGLPHPRASPMAPAATLRPLPFRGLLRVGPPVHLTGVLCSLWQVSWCSDAGPPGQGPGSVWTSFMSPTPASTSSLVTSFA